jgi:transcription elongation factor SPT6
LFILASNFVFFVAENGKDEYEKDNFIVDEAEEEDEEEAYVIKKGKAKKEKHQKRQKKRLVLDEDDYVLLEEARFHRPPRLVRRLPNQEKIVVGLNL